jgi:hypothetical protein
MNIKSLIGVYDNMSTSLLHIINTDSKEIHFISFGTSCKTGYILICMTHLTLIPVSFTAGHFV